MTDSENDTEQPEPVIDWKARSEQMFSENIRQAARYKARILAQGEEIQELKRNNADQRVCIANMRPADEKRKDAERRYDEANQNWAERLNEANGIIRALRKQLDGGERAAIESAIWYLNERARRLPKLPTEDTEVSA